MRRVPSGWEPVAEGTPGGDPFDDEHERVGLDLSLLPRLPVREERNDDPCGRGPRVLDDKARRRAAMICHAGPATRKGVERGMT
jgi:hypothetical protein